MPTWPTSTLCSSPFCFPLHLLDLTCLQALHIMSSGKGGQGEPDGADGQQAGSVDARLARLESHGYMAAARSNLELEAVLDSLKVGVQCAHRLKSSATPTRSVRKLAVTWHWRLSWTTSR